MTLASFMLYLCIMGGGGLGGVNPDPPLDKSLREALGRLHWHISGGGLRREVEGGYISGGGNSEGVYT